jgi:hypothetical protein
LDGAIIHEIFSRKKKKNDEREGWGGPVEFFLASLGYTSKSFRLNQQKRLNKYFFLFKLV